MKLRDNNFYKTIILLIMPNYKILVGNYIFDFESPNNSFYTLEFRPTTINNKVVLKMINTQIPFVMKNYVDIIRHLFYMDCLISNTIHNQKTFKKILEREELDIIIPIMDYSLLNIHEIEGFNPLHYELECKNRHVKWYFRHKINHCVLEEEREEEPQLTMGKYDGFQWIK